MSAARTSLYVVPVVLAAACLLSFLHLNRSFLVAPFSSVIGPAPLASPAARVGQGITLDVGTTDGTRNATAPHLPGILFEDIAHSGDGGIYAELIRNRAFQGSGANIGAVDPLLPGKVIVEAENPTLPFGPTLDGWYPIGDARLSLDLLHPLSDALQVVLQVDIPTAANGEVGFKNDGFWGMSVSPQTYNASFFAQTNGFRWNATLTHLNVALRDNATNEILSASSIPLNASTMPVPWMHRSFETQLDCNASVPSTSNALSITMDAEEARGQTFYFTLVSLFPETFNSRPNGLRPDLATGLEAANFRFLRFPGGNNLEGYSIQRRWKWWETLGPLKDRPGRVGDWSYFNTDGLGLLEFMYWCEDMGLAPILDVYAGFSLDVVNWDAGNSTDANELPIRMMEPILREALDELEFLTGGIDTYWGGKRAEHGHPEPFDVPFVEIGNEDFFAHNYPARAEYMYNGLRAHYPNITYIYSAGGIWPEGPMNISLPNGTIWDEHIYAPPQTFINSFDQFDNWQTSTNNPAAAASILEYHAGGGHPTIRAAVAEAVYALGWERNPQTVRLACFAPALQHRRVWRGTPYLALFDADPQRTVWSASYWQQWLFNRFRGAETVEVWDAEGRGFGPLYWVASAEGEVVFLKVVNAGEAWEPLRVRVDGRVVEVNGTTLHAERPEEMDAFNDVGSQKIVPRTINDLELEAQAGEVVWTVPPCSVSVLQLRLARDGSDDDRTGAPDADQPLLHGDAAHPLLDEQETLT